MCLAPVAGLHSHHITAGRRPGGETAPFPTQHAAKLLSTRHSARFPPRSPRTMGQANSRGAGAGAGAGGQPEQRTLGRRGLRRVSRVPAGDSASGSDHDTGSDHDRVPALLRRGTAPAALTPSPSRRLSQRLNPFQRYSSPAHAHDAVPSSPSPSTTTASALGRAASIVITFAFKKIRSGIMSLRS